MFSLMCDSPPQRNHQLDLDSVGHQDANHLLVGTFFHSAAHRGGRRVDVQCYDWQYAGVVV